MPVRFARLRRSCFGGCDAARGGAVVGGLAAEQLSETLPVFLPGLPIWIGCACGGDKDAVGLRIWG